ncbi:uncharacterized protein Triagg1_8416 [Trichoderma aggressivum f. europaeum]|uniref:Uncharacterized protein n=1 Tax=Trichoderma aggressivum f. europaeum TaxID=173218 RepID=A0AAE1I8G5_9HYPO|nr:hypothetical protein Triagg1_8416 [Trichoderma aggressivum f. europaeum]
MPRRRSSYEYSDDEMRYGVSHPSRPSRLYESSHPVKEGHFREVKSTARGPERERVVEHHDRPVRRHHNQHSGRHGQGEIMPHREARQSGRRGRSLHNEDDVEYRKRGDHHHHRSHTRARSENRLVEVATAALTAGVTEAIRARHDPERSRRAVTAAVSAAAMDALVSKDDDGKRGRHIVESAVGGMIVDRLANGRSRK